MPVTFHADAAEALRCFAAPPLLMPAMPIYLFRHAAAMPFLDALFSACCASLLRSRFFRDAYLFYAIFSLSCFDAVAPRLRR